MTEGKPNHQGEGGGRPPRWANQAELDEAIEAYFKSTEDKDTEGNKKNPGLFALCVHSSMSYDTLLEYESGVKDTETSKFSESIKNARLRIAAFAEGMIYDKTAGATFQLVNLTRKFSEPYKNAQHQELTGPNNGPVQFTVTPTQAGIL